jgi:hypothetical protein
MVVLLLEHPVPLVDVHAIAERRDELRVGLAAAASLQDLDLLVDPRDLIGNDRDLVRDLRGFGLQRHAYEVCLRVHRMENHGPALNSALRGLRSDASSTGFENCSSDMLLPVGNADVVRNVRRVARRKISPLTDQKRE